MGYVADGAYIADTIMTASVELGRDYNEMGTTTHNEFMATAPGDRCETRASTGSGGAGWQPYIADTHTAASVELPTGSSRRWRVVMVDDHGPATNANLSSKEWRWGRMAPLYRRH
jgi:hypothetical protein